MTRIEFEPCNAPEAFEVSISQTRHATVPQYECKGEVLWNERDSDKRRVTKGSVAFADGRIYYRTEEGAIVLIEPSRKEYLERGRFNQPERTDKPAWAHPVIANGKLYIRDQDTLFCYDVKAK